MQILRAGDHRRMPWKNGGGETVEIAVYPPGATVGDFDWRVSMATVASDGPFSVFEGIDRTLGVLSGDGIVLAVKGQAPVELRPNGVLHAFPADVPTRARLLAGPITDLNVMTRRGVFAHRLARQAATQAIAGPAEGAVSMVLALTACRLDATLLDPLDAVVLEPGDILALDPEPSAAVFVIEIMPVSPAQVEGNA